MNEKSVRNFQHCTKLELHHCAVCRWSRCFLDCLRC